ncbi:restriction endonuclease subunit S [Tissierella praeacuta]|uniref:restriction endonuclease subunit S n=1 Tax=Tissierella praeacuta TaxID=43131 RepID=UPI0028A2DBD0|nr:restriction endonuclease subunit S [Tissierella praeacuta]
MSREWKEVRLGDVIEFNPTETIKKGTISKKVGMEMLNPFQRKIEGFEVTEYKSGTKFRNGDTLLARITPCLENGKTAQVTILDDNEIGFGSTEFIVLRQKPKHTVNDFIYYLAISPMIRETAIKSMTGTSGRQRAQKDVIENTLFKLPPLKEQKAIAHILSTLDEKIEVNNQINKKLEEMAQTIFKHWFVDFEFPNENGEPYKSSGGEMVDSELGMIPKGWEVGCIGDYAKVKSGFAFKSAWWKEEGIPVIKIKNLQNNTIDFNDVGYVESDKIEKAKEFIVSGGDLLVAMTGATIGKLGLVPKYDGTILVNQRVGKFFLGDRPLERIGFLYCLVTQDSIYEEIVARGDGSAQPNISPSQIESIKITLPPKEKLDKINNILKEKFELMIQNIKENVIITQLRDTLLPKLMSGELRIPLEEVDIL